MSEVDTIPSATAPTSNGAPLDESGPEAQLEQIVKGISKTAKTNGRALDGIIEADLLTPLLETFAKAAEAHAGLLETLNQNLQDASSSHWQAILSYRQTTRQRVLAPLNARLNTNIADQVGKRFIKLFADLRNEVSNYPEALIIPEPAELYEPQAEDRFLIRLRKRQVRTTRSFRNTRQSIANGFRRLFRKEPGIAQTPILNIDVRQLLQYHVDVRLPLLLESKFDAFHALLTDRIASYEKAETQWSYALREIEQQFALPAYKVSELQSWLPETKENKEGQEAHEHVKSPAKDLIQRLLQMTEALQTCIQQIAAEPLPEFKIADEQYEAAAAALHRDLECGDTFLLPDRVIPDSNILPAANLEQKTARWSTWYRESSNRVNMNGRLHELRDFLLKQQDSLLNSIAKASIIPILNSFNQLRTAFTEAREEADRICDTSVTGTTEEVVLVALKPLHQKISQQFKGILNDVTNLIRAGQALDQPGAMVWNDFHRFIDTLSDRILVHETLDSPAQLKDLSRHQYSIHLRELVYDALIEPLSIHLTKPAKTLQKAVIQTWEETQQVEYTVDYNLKAAFDELEVETEEEAPAADPATSMTPEEILEHHPIEAAHELISSGLSRSSEKLGELILELHKPWRQLVDQVFSALQTYSIDILHNVREADDMNDRWTNFKMKVNRALKRLHQFSVQFIDEASVVAGRVVKLGRRQTKQLIKKGQTAVGVVDQSEDQWLQTLELASDIDALHKRLPLVYRRLFSLKPLDDLDLLEGRKLDLAFVSKHFAQWKNSQTGPLLLAMPDGSGRRSLMNVIVNTVLEDADVNLINLKQRVSDVQSFANLVADALGIKSEKSLPIDILESQIIGMKRTGKPRVVVIDRFEHLLLCAPGGQDLIERVLIFMSRTDNLIYWVINVGIHAWHFLEKTMSPSSGFISAYKVTNLNRQALEDIILKRHNRSGMSLHFRANTASNSIFDISRSKSEKTLQETYRNAFFDRLHRLSGQNILLALLYWLRSVEFDNEQDTLYVNTIEPINFSFLDTLDLSRAFTLKSFLTHGTLTRQDHMRVYKLGQAESTFILESLLNLRIIEPAFQDPDEKIHYRIEPNHPYRLHPLIVYPVLELLKRRHIVY